MKKLYLLWLILFLGLCTLGIMMAGAGIVPFISVASLFIVLGPPLIMSLSNYSPHEIFKYFALGYSESGSNTRQLRNGILYFTALQRYLVCSGFIGTFIGLVTMLALLEDPSKIGKGMSMALLSILYALILSVGVTIPFKTGLQRELNAHNAE